MVNYRLEGFMILKALVKRFWILKVYDSRICNSKSSKNLQVEVLRPNVLRCD